MHDAREIRPDKVAIYIRWSTDDQGDGTTLAVQQEGCQHYVLSQGWQVTPSLIFIDDGYSGGTLDRPRLSDLRQAVTAGAVDCVVVYKLDRLSRSVMDTVNLVLDEWDGRTFLKSAREPVDTTTPMGKQFFYMLVSYAEWERSVIKERTQSGKVKRAREGRNPGGPVPYGYRLSGQPGILEVDPERAGIVRRIFDAYQEEQGTFRIADQLNRDGIPSPTGGTWYVNTLLKILKNPIYCGRLRYGKRSNNPRRQRDKSQPRYLQNPSPIEAESQFPAIVAREEFERVQGLMAARGPMSTGVRALASDHLLTGILKCACGAPLVSHRSVHPDGRVYRYYGCQNYKGRGAAACKGGMIPQEALDRQIEAMLYRLLNDEQAFAEFAAQRRQHAERQLAETAERTKQVQAALALFNEQAQRLNRDYRSGHLSATLYDENRREIDRDRVAAREQLTFLTQLESALACQLHEHDPVRQTCDLAHRWNELDTPQRKVILRHLIGEVVAFKPAGTKEVSVRVQWKTAAPTPSLPGPLH